MGYYPQPANTNWYHASRNPVHVDAIQRNSLLRENQHLANSLQVVTSEKEKLLSLNKTLKDRLTAKEHQVDQLNQEYDNLNRKYSDTSKELADRKKQHRTCMVTIMQMSHTTRIERERQKSMERMEHKVQAMRREIEEKNKEIDNLRKKIRFLQQSNEECKRGNEANYNDARDDNVFTGTFNENAKSRHIFRNTSHDEKTYMRRKSTEEENLKADIEVKLKVRDEGILQLKANLAGQQRQLDGIRADIEAIINSNDEIKHKLQTLKVNYQEDEIELPKDMMLKDVSKTEKNERQHKENDPVWSDEFQEKEFQLQSQMEQRITQLEQELIQYQHENEELKKATEEELTRLSITAGAKMTHCNTAITDIGVEYDPTKIAEKFSELYENSWTIAFEEIEEIFDIDEKDIVEILLSVLKGAYKMSTEAEKEYELSIRRAITTIPTTGHVYDNQGSYVIPTNDPLIKALYDIRISLGAPCALLIQKMFLSRLPDLLHQELNKYKPGSTVDLYTIPKTVHYAKSCASLSWHMRIREPPLYIHFDFQSRKAYDENSYRHYTKSGTLMDYVVWPALYLHEHGPLLGKGVAQPI